MRVSDQVNVTDGFFCQAQFWIVMKITSKQLFDKIEKAGAVHDANNLFERKAAIVIQKGRDDSLFSSSSCIFKFAFMGKFLQLYRFVAYY